MRWRLQLRVEYMERGAVPKWTSKNCSNPEQSWRVTFAALVLTQLPSTLPKAFLETDRIEYAYDGSRRASGPGGASGLVASRGSKSNSDPTTMWVRPLPCASRAAPGHVWWSRGPDAREPRMLTYPPRASLNYVPLAHELSAGIRKGETQRTC